MTQNELALELTVKQSRIAELEREIDASNATTLEYAERVGELEKQLAAKAAECERMIAERDSALADNAAMLERMRRMEEALRFYVDVDNWTTGKTEEGYEIVFWLPNTPGPTRAAAALRKEDEHAV